MPARETRDYLIGKIESEVERLKRYAGDPKKSLEVQEKIVLYEERLANIDKPKPHSACAMSRSLLC